MSTRLTIISALIAAALGVLGIAICKSAQRADHIMATRHRAELERMHAAREGGGQ